MLDEELDDLGLYLQAEDSLWWTTSHEEWFRLARLRDRTDILGVSVREAIQAFLDGGKYPLPPFNQFSSFIIIHGLIRTIYVYFITSMHDQQRYRVKQALDVWNQQNLLLLQRDHAFETTSFKWVGLFIYMLTVVLHGDTTRLATQADKNFEMFSAWVEEIPDTPAEVNVHMKASCISS